ncbi:hypothetical protein Gohar_007351 [Gossypium harknessii]|uniref:Fe2OG dioxygenase domain-containing protein n=1 Tax=Gossypium harknessii TaxID=34285 RepID=A0A7J9GGJ2_9ROSI|nr:hypothetical protein [Gossypium harknessii]
METGVINREGFGGSLPVEKVQALASKNLKDIPSRYIRPEVEFDVVSIDESYQIPVIDMSKLGHDDEQQKLHLACKDWGFFQLINHGVGDEVIDKMKIDIQEFFELPLNEKLAYRITLKATAKPLETLDKYSMALQKVTIRLTRLIAKNLGTDPETFASFFEDGTQGIRMNYYPPCAQASKVIGLAPHSDSTALTLLIQVNEVEGLQIKKNGKWIPVKPISGAFIINIGDVMEIMSNGEYKSIEHRAVVNPNKERLSIAAFHSPNISTMIGPLPDVVKAKEAGYRTKPHEEFVRLTISSKLDGKGLLDQMKL